MKNRNLLLTLTALLSVTLLGGCNGGGGETTVYVNKGAKLVSNGVSNYQIAVKDGAGGNTVSAASELSEFIEKATGATLDIVEEGSDEFKPNEPYISIGWTDLAEKAGITLPAGKNYMTSGYYIKTEGKNIYIVDNKDAKGEGLVYGVYDFLNEIVDFKVYANDEIYYTEKSTVYLPNLDKTYVPSFDVRELGYKELISDKVGSRRLRLVNKSTDSRFAMSGHTLTGRYNSLLNYTTYLEEHPEWYCQGGTVYNEQIQLCYTARGNESDYQAMVDTCAQNMYRNYILKYPDAEYFMMGHADTHNWCACDACVQAMKDHECPISGLQTLFTNDVIERVDEIIAENNDTVNAERDIKYVVFAYTDTENPSDPTNHPELKLNKKLYVMYTPIEMNFSLDMHTGSNVGFYDNLVTWNELSEGRILLYVYDINFYYFFINFNNFGTFKSHAIDYMNNGVTYFYSQAPVINNACGLTRMRFYVESSLLWDIDQDYDTLAYEFMDHYYKDGAEYMKEYYDITRNRYAYYIANVDQNIGGIYAKISNAVLWDQPTTVALYDSLKNALKAVEKYQLSDPELYETLSWRIREELVTVYFIILTNYQGLYSSETVSAMINDFHDICDHFEFTKSFEGATGLPF